MSGIPLWKTQSIGVVLTDSQILLKKIPEPGLFCAGRQQFVTTAFDSDGRPHDIEFFDFERTFIDEWGKTGIVIRWITSGFGRENLPPIVKRLGFFRRLA